MDSKGRIVTDYDKELPLKSTLLYEDGSPAPLKTSKGKKLLFRCMKEAVLGRGIWRDSCIFRIEEVSSKQKGVPGFKVEVSPESDSCGDVVAGVMEEIIIVKSKLPKEETKSIEKRARGGRTSVLYHAKRQRIRTPSEESHHSIMELEGGRTIISNQTNNQFLSSPAVVTRNVDTSIALGLHLLRT
jgi:hypothetical protein